VGGSIFDLNGLARRKIVKKHVKKVKRVAYFCRTHNMPL
jgi:hypothetical protein